MGRVVDEFEHDDQRYLLVGYSPPRPACLEQLTPGELDVIDRWLAGETTASIASGRNVSKRTVANQIASAYRKLGVGSREELFALIYRVPADLGRG